MDEENEDCKEEKEALFTGEVLVECKEPEKSIWELIIEQGDWM